MKTKVAVRAETYAIAGCDLEVVVVGSGDRPVLALHGGNGPIGSAPFGRQLGDEFTVYFPSHPGFGRSSRPKHISKVDDLAYLYLDFMEMLDIRDVSLIGFSIGGWIAMEVAVRSISRISRLALVGGVGVKLGDRETRDFPDLFAMSAEEVARLAFHDPRNARIDFEGMSEDELIGFFRNREAFALYAWEPYLHNPHLKHWLHRVRLPALFLWGESDGLVSPDYGRAYAALLPDAEFDVVKEAGHAPHIEQPARFVPRLRRFLSEA